MVRRKTTPSSVKSVPTNKLIQEGIQKLKGKKNKIFKNKIPKNGVVLNESVKKSPRRSYATTRGSSHKSALVVESSKKQQSVHVPDGSKLKKKITSEESEVSFESFDDVLTEAIEKSLQNSSDPTKSAHPYSTKALQEIRRYQKSVHNLIPKAAFARVCRDIFVQYGGPDIRVGFSALECLQESAEMYVVQLFEDSYLCTLHANRKTLFAKDIRLARRIGGRSGVYL